MREKHFPKVCYEIFVRSFCDSNKDGVGDIAGITSKLDYLKELGIEAIWLTPIHPSPSYHKYDVIDYYGIDLDFGTLQDFKKLVTEAKLRGIAILIDLVINHTSTLHPWFIEASKRKNNFHRNFYWWKNELEIKELGIAKRAATDDSQEVYPWHDNKYDDEKYYGLFYKGMPDLNYHSKELKIEIIKIMDFWLNDMEVAGFRIDAARHIFPPWDASFNLDFWNFFKSSLNQLKPEAFTIGEIWADPIEIAPYFQGIDAVFNFELSFAIQKVLSNEKNEHLITQLIAVYQLYSIHKNDFIDAIMLSNHDQVRIGSILDGNIEKLKLAATILLTLPGQPFIYYGEEIGMLGKKPDQHIREPFIWSKEENDTNTTHWIAPKFSTNETISDLALQLNSPESLVNHYKKLIKIRTSNETLGHVHNYNIQPFQEKNTKILGYIRSLENQSILIIHNLIAKKQIVNIDKILIKFLILAEPSVINYHKKTLTLNGYKSVILDIEPEKQI